LAEKNQANLITNTIKELTNFQQENSGMLLISIILMFNIKMLKHKFYFG